MRAGTVGRAESAREIQVLSGHQLLIAITAFVVGVAGVILSGLAMPWMAMEPALWPYWVLPLAIGAVTCLVAEGSPSLPGLLVGTASGWALEVLLELGGVQTHLNVGGRLSELDLYWPIVFGLIVYDLAAAALGFAMVRRARGRVKPGTSA
jgi:hypothetical protein